MRHLIRLWLLSLLINWHKKVKTDNNNTIVKCLGYLFLNIVVFYKRIARTFSTALGKLNSHERITLGLMTFEMKFKIKFLDSFLNINRSGLVPLSTIPLPTKMI